MLSRLIMLMKAAFVPYSTEYTTPGTSTISIPAGATTVTIECIGSGARGDVNSGVRGAGGGGSAYAKKNTYSLSGLTGIYISVSAINTTEEGAALDSFAKENSSGGTTICLAAGAPGAVADGSTPLGGTAASSTGDVKYSGGSGASVHSSDEVASGGGGSAGPSGAGGNASYDTAGTGNGAPAGNGGSGSGVAGSAAGGGGGAHYSGTSGNGARGWIKLSWA